MAPQWSNWARTAQATPSRVETPSSTEALADAVAGAAHEGRRVRAFGTGLSANAIAAADDIAIDTRGMRGLRSIDRAAGVATFGAGTTVAEASALLEAEGLALANPTSNTAVTLAGAAATGSHASSLRAPSSSSQLMGATLVDGSGRVVCVSERRNPELLPAVRLGLGALGVMSEVTVRILPAHRVVVVERHEPLHRVLRSIERRAAAGDHVAVRWLPHTDNVIVRTATRQAGPISDEPEPGPASQAVRRVREGLRVGFVKAFPLLVPAGNRLKNALHRDRVGLAGPTGAVAVNPPLPYASMAYAFPLDRLADMVRELDGLIESGGFRVPARVLLTFAPADDVFLSTAYGRATGSIGLAMPQGIDPRPLFHAAEQGFLAGGGLPHWNTYHTVRAAEFAHVMPRFHDFLAARDRLDPERRFENAHVRRVLGH